MEDESGITIQLSNLDVRRLSPDELKELIKSVTQRSFFVLAF